MPSEKRESLLGSDWSSSGDVAWTTSGDAQGLHILTAKEQDGYTWKTAATLSEPGFDADAWIGNVCVTGSGQRAVVVYAPRTFTNKPQLMARGAFTAIVNLSSGAVQKLPVKTSLSYYNPGCGTGETAVLTQSGGDDLPGTRLIRLDAASGKTSAPVKVTGQVTSTVPAENGEMLGASGAQIVRIDQDGHRTPVVRTDQVPYRLTPDGKGGLVFLDKRGTTSSVKRLAAKDVNAPHVGTAKAALLAEGAATETGLTRSAGTVYITGRTSRPRAVAAMPSVVERRTELPRDATVSTRGAAAITGTQWGDGKGTMLLPGEATKARAVKLSMAVTSSKAKASFVVDPERRESSRIAEGTAPSPALTGHGNAPKRMQAAVAGDPSDPVEEERTCSVPRNDPRNQAMQPKPRQVEWAVDQAIKGYLNTLVQRPANWKNLGMPSYMPQSLFPNPALVDGDRAMAQVMLGITTQESNMWQAGREAVPGVTANPLIGNYYGIDLYDGDSSNDWDIDFAEADCGYGITQVTDHMRMAGREDGHGGAAWDYQKQRAAALDYTANIAAGLQILISKWNETRSAGLIANHGSTGRPENWYFAVWAYNSGFHPNNGDGSPWGLGWANNPANPEWDAGRLPFMESAAGGEDASAAARPQNWPYQEKVLGFAAHPPSFLESPGNMVAAFRPSTWNGTGEAVTVKGSALYNRAHLKAPEDAFCVPTSNDCFPGRISDGASNDNGSSGPCGREDFMCWWHEPVTWKTDCVDTCGFEFIRFNQTYPEEADGTAYPPNCTISGLPSGALIVDDVPQGTPVARPGCTNSTWTNSGTFTMNFANNGVEAAYPAKVDLHQLGAGFGGHFYFGHTRADDAKGQRLQITGTWKLDRTLDKDARVWVHLPDHGAQTKQAMYQIKTVNGWVTRLLPQAGTGNRWANIGVHRVKGTVPEVKLSTITPDGTGDDDIAFDAVAFEPGDFGNLPDVTVPDPDPNSPEANYEDQVPMVGTLGSSAVTAKSAAEPKRTTSCSKRDAQGRQQCVTITRGADVPLSALPKENKRTTQQESPGGLAPWCDFTSPTNIMVRTRLQACETFNVSATWSVNDIEVGTAKFYGVQEFKTYSQAPTVIESLTLTATSVPTQLGAVTLKKWSSSCAPNCETSTQPDWNGVPTWAAAVDHHSITGYRSHSWTNTEPAPKNVDELTLSSALDFGSALVSGDDSKKSLATWADVDEVRCDSLFPANTRGCVFQKYPPTLEMNFKKYPAAALYYWILQEKLDSHPGQFPDHPLHKEGTKAVNDRNREVVCELGGKGIRLKPEFHHLATGDNLNLQCDEYPFASSKESGGQFLDNGSTTKTYGSECTTLYAKKDPNGWHIYNDERFPVPTWTEICGRASMPGQQNQDAGSSLSGFVSSLRLHDDDPYFIKIPELEGCDPDAHCTIS